MFNKIVLASNNKKKMKEMNELLAPLGIEVVRAALIFLLPRSLFLLSLKILWQKPVMPPKSLGCLQLLTIPVFV